MSPKRTRNFRAARIAVSKSASGFDVELPRSLKAERRDDIAVLFLARAEKRNAIDDPTVFGIEAFFAALPDTIKAVVLAQGRAPRRHRRSLSCARGKAQRHRRSDGVRHRGVLCRPAGHH